MPQAVAAKYSTSIHARLATGSLPSTQLDFGLANGPSDIGWMTASGVPWHFRYQYLSAGVNTGNGWETWNSPPGAFATYYMNASNANGYTPVLTYYELLQSNPSSGSNESDRDFNNLNNTATMAAYYANFKLLMQTAASYGKTVVVHVEPDLWGYLEQRAGTGDASSLTASVASSGFTEAQGFPNTAQGFAWELIKLRDLYAPSNVLLAIHASMWASGVDVASSTDPNLDPQKAADATAAFMNSAGISPHTLSSTWDLVFNDVDDHDAGWWEKQGANNAGFTHWWDPNNFKVPNFTRYLAWVSELHTQTARQQVVWQVPVGNQVFLTMNNTCGHYQDNVAQYFISHADDLYKSGLVAVLFGAGNACQTSYTDARGDGITNNGGAPTTDAQGSCYACNTQVSSWSDDDGGLLRTWVGSYYKGWKSLGGIVVGGPDASSSGAKQVDVFVRGTDGGAWYREWNGTTWGGWGSAGGVATSDPSSLNLMVTSAPMGPPYAFEVFVRGTDNAVWHRQWTGLGWADWQSVGGVATSGPDAASQGSGQMDFVVRGTDNAIWHRNWNNSLHCCVWSAWDSAGGVATSDPSLTSWGAGRIDLFVRGTDNALWHRSGDGQGTWAPWESLGGYLTGAPDATSCIGGHIDVYVPGSNGTLWHRSFNSTWSDWSQVPGGPWTSNVGAACQPGPMRKVSLFERGPDNALWTTTVDGT
jgi:hypothetical protein